MIFFYFFLSPHEAEGIRLGLAPDRWALGSQSPHRLDLGPEAEKGPKWKQRLSWNDRRGYYRIRKVAEGSSVIPFMWRGRGWGRRRGAGKEREREQKRVEEEDKARREERGGGKRTEERKGIKEEEKEEGKEERELGGRGRGSEEMWGETGGILMGKIGQGDKGYFTTVSYSLQQ